MNNIASHQEIESSYYPEDLLEATLLLEYREAYQYTQQPEKWEPFE